MEGQNFEIRKDVLKYDDVLNKQRTVIYDERRRILEGLDLSEQIRPMIESVVRSYVEGDDRATATPRSGISSSSGPRCARCTRCR